MTFAASADKSRDKEKGFEKIFCHLSAIKEI